MMKLKLDLVDNDLFLFDLRIFLQMQFIMYREHAFAADFEMANRAK